MSKTAFLSGGGEMGEIIRNYPWHQHPLGEPGNWPQTLKTTLRLLLSTGHPMFIWWGQDLFQFYNDAYRRSIGPERHPSAIGQRGRECWAEIWQVIGPQIQSVMNGEGHTWHENHLVPITRNGQKEDVYWTYSYGPIDDPESPQQVGGVLVVCSETTKTVTAELQREENEKKWRSLFELAPTFIVILNGPEHIYEFANKKFFELFGALDCIGKPVAQVTPELVDQGFTANLDAVFSSGLAFEGRGTRVSFRRHDEFQTVTNIYLDFICQPTRNAQGAITGIFIVGYDVTDRITANEKLQKQDRRKDEFLAMLAHELRNPLAPIHNAGEILRRSDKPQDLKIAKIGEMLCRQSSQLKHLVDDLLDVSRINLGRIKLKREHLDISDLINATIEALRAPMQEKALDFSYEPAQLKYMVSGDATRLIQCFSNVLANAIKYTPDKGQIGISFEHLASQDGDDCVKVSIWDTGIGIGADMLEDIFDLFVRVERKDDSASGLGIGLALVRQLLSMHGGSISVSSKGLGHGSKFTITLPIVETNKYAAVPDEPMPEASSSEANQADQLNQLTERNTAKKIVLVDDNTDAASTLRDILVLLGHQVDIYHSAEDALENISDSTSPDIFFLDIGLPEMDGYELAQRLQQIFDKVPMVALTGYGQAEDVQRALDAGFSAHHTKPLTVKSLQTTMKRIFNN